MAERHGGRIDGDELLVKTQDPAPATLEIWDDQGSPVERIPVTDDRWSWKGEWQDTTSNWGPRHTVRTSNRKGAEAAIKFEGTGAIISGFYLPSGGKADIYLDGELDRTIDVYPDGGPPQGVGVRVARLPTRGRQTCTPHRRAGRALSRLDRQRHCAHAPCRISMSVSPSGREGELDESLLLQDPSASLR